LLQVIKIYLYVLFAVSISFTQTQHTIMTYNLMNYPDVDTTGRNPYFRTTFSSIQPDILVIQEVTSLAGVNGILNNVLNKVSSGYSAGAFINGPDTDNAIFFKNAIFSFISNTAITTALRNINEFKLRHISTGDTLIIYSLHLKANQTGVDSLARAAEVDSLRKRTATLSSDSYYLVCGDFNIYSANELAYQKLKSQSSNGYFLDVLNLPGNWNNSSYAIHHTQSTRTRDFDGGSTGGLDDRFDMILMSPAIINSGGISYVANSYQSYGNDGLHFNDSINQPPNNAVGQSVANALHYSSDHLPVIASFSFDAPYMELTAFKALIEGLYNGSTMIPDTVTVELRDNSTPYALIDQAKIYLNNAGTGTGKFYSALNGIPYYLVLKHRNAIETWSGTTQVFLNSTLSYDFTTSPAKSYGNNLKQVGTKWCIYSGDVNQDGTIDSQDLNSVYGANIFGVTGYTSTDITGDSFTEIGDLTNVFINNIFGIERKRPIDFPVMQLENIKKAEK
jgi:endonuclease/exonuclease/phosphatase family metal-dependent hydrolase